MDNPLGRFIGALLGVVVPILGLVGYLNLTKADRVDAYTAFAAVCDSPTATVAEVDAAWREYSEKDWLSDGRTYQNCLSKITIGEASKVATSAGVAAEKATESAENTAPIPAITFKQLCPDTCTLEQVEGWEAEGLLTEAQVNEWMREQLTQQQLEEITP